MKANELRIGNLLYYGKDLIKVSASDFAVFELYESKGQDHPYKPILITEEWLLKFGFEIDEDCDLIYNYPYKASWITVCLGDNFHVGIVKDKSHIALMDAFTHIQYVHQLQNLYFALTEEELTIEK